VNGDPGKPGQRTGTFSVTEIRNALRCPRVFALGRARGQKVMFPIGASALGAVFHRLVAAFARQPRGRALDRLAPAAPVDEVASALTAGLIRLLAAELERSPSYVSMPAEVDDLAEALREFARHVASACATRSSSPASAVARFLAGAEVPIEVEVDSGRARLRLSGRIDALHVPPGGAAEVVEYKLTDDSSEELDRAQVALYRFLLARARDLDAAPVILRFGPRLTITRLAPRDADALVATRLLPLVAEMDNWVVEPSSAPATERIDLCPACPVRTACAELYPEPLPARDEPPSGAARPRPDASGEVKVEEPRPPVAPGPNLLADAEGGAVAEAERIRGLILELLRGQGVAMPTSRAPVIGARLLQVEVSVARGSVSAIERAAADVEHRLEADHRLTARFHRKGGLRVFTVARAEPRTVRLSDLLAAREAWLRQRAGRFVLGETVDRRVLDGDLADPSSCHLLVAGTTGSGKSVLLRGIAASLVHFHAPTDIQLTLIDPKRVSFGPLAAGMAGHLSGPLIHDVEEAIPVLEACIEEMEERYGLFAAARVQDISEYNELKSGPDRLARQIIIIDEFQDLVAARSTREAFIDAVQRLGSKARASGIHLVLSTQRPTRDNVPGGIKGNLQGKIALKVTSAIESRVILGDRGAEDLLGKGDLLADLGQGMLRAQAPLDGR
jgi:S-DNA-T family DNA segregation ATPase FtsK/SpoIIIE